MNNNKKLNVIKFIAMFLSLVILAGCSSSNQTKEATKKYSLTESDDVSTMIVVYYEEGTDKVLKQDVTTTIKLSDDVTKDIISKNFETLKAGAIEGTDNKLDITDKEAVIVRSVDFTKIDIEKATQLGLMPDSILSDDKKTASLKKLEEAVKKLGFSENQ